VELPGDLAAKRYKSSARLKPLCSRIRSAWPQTIVFGHSGASLGDGRKTGLFETEIAKGFWPPASPAENTAPGRPLCPRFYAGSADHPHADPCPAGIRRPAWLDDHIAGETNRLGCLPARKVGATAGGGTPAGDASTEKIRDVTPAPPNPKLSELRTRCAERWQ
jgi:hypothetical protein